MVNEKMNCRNDEHFECVPERGFSLPTDLELGQIPGETGCRLTFPKIDCRMKPALVTGVQYREARSYRHHHTI